MNTVAYSEIFTTENLSNFFYTVCNKTNNKILTFNRFRQVFFY